MSYIIFNNLDSRDLDITIENIPNIPTSNRIYETVEIDGGENLTKIKGFENIEISFNFVYKAKEDEYLKKKQRIDSWLLGNVNKYLTYNLDNFSAYRVKKVSIDNTTTTSRIVRHFTVTFTCTGLKYMSSGLNSLELATTGIKINNSGDYESKPLLKIFGSGNITISIGSNSFTINNVNNYVVIDSELKECYKDRTNMGKNMTGDYPILLVGENTISWTGNVTKVELTPRWRCF